MSGMLYFFKNGPGKPLLRNRFKKGVFLGGILLLALVVLFFVVNEKRGGNEVVLNVFSDKADLEVRDFHFTEVGDPELIWEIDAESAEYIKGENRALFHNIKARVTLADGSSYVMTGREGILKTDTKDIYISGGVSVISDVGDRFETDYLKFSHSERRIYTEEDVTMANSFIKVRGRGMTINLKERSVSLLSNVNVEINHKDSASISN
jgi:LPS export ABC transporter protein LptC